MKVIDLLVKIANGEKVPKSFKIKGYRRTFIYNKETKWFEDIVDDSYCKNEIFLSELNDEIEIIEDTLKEDKKIDKIKDYSIMTTMGLDSKLQERKISKDIKLEEIVDKINEIIDKINGEEK